MTAVSALLLALITGWLVPAPRLAMAAFLGPWLIALIYQTADIGLGYAVSPPQTVTQFPRVIGYVVVTAVILALGLILSALIGERRSRAVPDAGRQTAREMAKRATLAGTVVVAALICLDIAGCDHSSHSRPWTSYTIVYPSLLCLTSVLPFPRLGSSGHLSNKLRLANGN